MSALGLDFSAAGECCCPQMMPGSICGDIVVYTRKSLQTQAFYNISLDVFSYTGISTASSGKGLDYY